jgi:hypothetical protein
VLRLFQLGIGRCLEPDLDRIPHLHDLVTQERTFDKSAFAGLQTCTRGLSARRERHFERGHYRAARGHAAVSFAKHETVSAAAAEREVAVATMSEGRR